MQFQESSTFLSHKKGQPFSIALYLMVFGK